MARRGKRGPRQGALAFPEWGGRRKGAGRKPNGERSGVSHLRRAPLASRFPVHVTLSLAEGLPPLRIRKLWPVLNECFDRAKEKPGFRVVHFGVLDDHVHLIVEGADRERLARGMQGLCIRLAKALNRFWGRKGKVFADRYHDRILRTPREVRNALVYVLRNAKKHFRQGIQRIASYDGFSSALWFDGWKANRGKPFQRAGTGPVAEARTWLLSEGWRRHGLIGRGERPAGAR